MAAKDDRRCGHVTTDSINPQKLPRAKSTNHRKSKTKPNVTMNFAAQDQSRKPPKTAPLQFVHHPAPHHFPPPLNNRFFPWGAGDRWGLGRGGWCGVDFGGEGFCIAANFGSVFALGKMGLCVRLLGEMNAVELSGDDHKRRYRLTDFGSLEPWMFLLLGYWHGLLLVSRYWLEKEGRRLKPRFSLPPQ